MNRFSSPSPETLNEIVRILTERERQRRGISAYLTAIGTSDEQFSTLVGSSNAHARQNRLVL